MVDDSKCKICKRNQIHQKSKMESLQSLAGRSYDALLGIIPQKKGLLLEALEDFYLQLGFAGMLFSSLLSRRPSSLILILDSHLSSSEKSVLNTNWFLTIFLPSSI